MNNQLYDLIPHREPMLLLNKVIAVADNSSSSEIIISASSSFFLAGRGVPSWIGIEYMGQTAALIAGYQRINGKVAPHVGMLLGTRKYEALVPWFCEDDVLVVTCAEIATVGEQLATFMCEIHNKESGVCCARAKLSVFRKPLN